MPTTNPRMIEADAMYQLSEFKERLGVKKAAWSKLLRQGLPVIRIGRRGYVRGSDAMEFMGNLKA